MKCKNLIVDANIFIAMALANDPHNNRVLSTIDQLGSHCFFSNNYIVAEAFTVTLIKSKNLQIVDDLNQLFKKSDLSIKITQVPVGWEPEIMNVFLQQKKYKGYLSYMDCSLIVQARKQKIPTIFTFDQTFAQFKREFEIVGI